jgi:S-adenosylmethionine:tRNA ribosyltransferase-isomerase
MMVVDRSERTFRDSRFEELTRLLRKGDVLVLNNTKVFPARLVGLLETGARIEIFLTDELAKNEWECLARPAKRLKLGRRIIFGPELTSTVNSVREGGRAVLTFDTRVDLFEQLEQSGQTPLPPYIKRAASAEDRTRYQTVYARKRGAIAAPTAGLHFTDGVLKTVRDQGVIITEVTLHVGYGTFEPVRTEDLSHHSVLPEKVHIEDVTAEILNAAKRDGRRIIAVGTTTTRALEWNISRNGVFKPDQASADLTIIPGYKFKAVSALLTNFHLPQSSLLILVSTFAGRELIMDAYEHAVAERYRFYSYGDCMFIV